MMGGLVVVAEEEEVTGEIGARQLGCIESIYTTKMIALLMHASIILHTLYHFGTSSRLYSLPFITLTIFTRQSEVPMPLLFAKLSANLSTPIRM